MEDQFMLEMYELILNFYQMYMVGPGGKQVSLNPIQSDAL